MNEQRAETMDVTEINIPFPEAPDLHLRIGVGACQLRIRPGDGEAWVEGSYRHPAGTLPPKIERDGGTVRLSQESKITGWPSHAAAPTFDLRLGKAKSYLLTVETGASDSEVDLGGLPLGQLKIRQGAGRMAVDFSAPNPQAMSDLDLDAGAGAVELKNLANAGFAEMTINGGAAAFKLDFGGNLQRDARVRVTTGMAGMVVKIPASTAAKIVAETTLAGVDVGDGFAKKQGAFWNEAALAGRTPVLSVQAKIVMGGLSLRQE